MKVQFELLVDDFLDSFIVISGDGFCCIVDLDLSRKFLVQRDDRGFVFFQHTIKAAQHRQRNHYAAILWRTVRAAKQVGDIPDDIAVLFEGVEGFHKVIIVCGDFEKAANALWRWLAALTNALL